MRHNKEEKLTVSVENDIRMGAVYGSCVQFVGHEISKVLNTKIINCSFNDFK